MTPDGVELGDTPSALDRACLALTQIGRRRHLRSPFDGARAALGDPGFDLLNIPHPRIEELD